MKTMILTDENGEKYKVEKLVQDKEEPKKSMRIALVVGHYLHGTGAYSANLENSEYDYFFNSLRARPSENITIFTHNLKGGYTARQRDLAELTKDYDLVIELHFNSFDGKVGGCEFLYWHENAHTEYLGAHICESIEKSMGIKYRRSIPVHNRDINGGGFIIEQKTDAILLECFFGDNESDCKKWDMRKFIEILEELK